MNNYDENTERDSIMIEDKIINNSYNTGEIDFEAFTTPMRVDSDVYSMYEDQLSDDMSETRIVKELSETMYTIFELSPFFEKYKNPRRVDKGDMIKMYYYFKEKLVRKNIYSASQIFMGFAEFFQISYESLYGEIGVLDKEVLLKELNTFKGIKKLLSSKRLF